MALSSTTTTSKVSLSAKAYNPMRQIFNHIDVTVLILVFFSSTMKVRCGLKPPIERKQHNINKNINVKLKNKYIKLNN